MVVEGEYEIGEGMKSARGCGLRVSVSDSFIISHLHFVFILVQREEGG